jgi:hypothetical protein
MKAEDMTAANLATVGYGQREVCRHSTFIEHCATTPSSCSVEMAKTAMQSEDTDMYEVCTPAMPVLALPMFSSQPQSNALDDELGAIAPALTSATSVSMSTVRASSMEPLDIPAERMENTVDPKPTTSCSTIQTDMDSVLVKDEPHQYSTFQFDLPDAAGFSDLFSADLSDASCDQYARKFESGSSSGAMMVPDIVPASSPFSNMLVSEDLVLALLSGNVDVNSGVTISRTNHR